MFLPGKSYIRMTRLSFEGEPYSAILLTHDRTSWYSSVSAVFSLYKKASFV